VSEATTRAAVLVAPGRAEIREVPLPEPGPAEVLVRLEGCGVCGSNAPAWEGRDWFRYPLAPGAPGHEGWGRVAAIGPGVAGVREGDRVAGLFGAAFAAHDVAPAAQVVPLPPALDGRPFPGEPLACALNVFRRARVAPGDLVAVVGVGFLGAVVTRMAAAAGARVVAFARRGWALDLARRLGAAAAVALDGDPRARARELAGGVGCDVAVEAVGLQGPLDLAADLLREGGRLVVAGFHQDGRRSIDLGGWNWRALELVNAHFRDPAVQIDGLRAAIDAVLSGALDLELLVTHRFPLDRIGDAFAAMRSRPDGFLKGIVVP
jgi:2-desacetyl-2-hydroxyethyl bacteriochlorophyllide A dehydrogenase